MLHSVTYYRLQNILFAFPNFPIAGVVAYSSRNPPELLSGQLITGAKLRSCLEPDLELNTIIDDPSLAYANTRSLLLAGSLIMKGNK